ncbi:MAG: hypothetical protein IKU01_01675 [Bacteroidales bacterium]|nr:hypothetical protein [Bacteroidales bacterium]
MENKQVFLTSTSKAYVVIDIPDLHLKRLWEKKGAKKPIAFDILQQAIYDPSVEYLLNQGILVIDDMDVKIALGLEAEDVKETGKVNLIALSDSDMERYMTVMPIYEFKEKIKELKKEQIFALTDYAIEHELTNMEKCDILKGYTEIDIIRAVQLNRDNEGE